METPISQPHNKQRHLEAQYREFVSNASLTDDMNKDFVLESREYGKNHAQLRTSEESIEKFIETVKSSFATIEDSFLIEVTIRLSVNELFNQHITATPLDPDVNAEINSILTILDETAVAIAATEFYHNLEKFAAPKIVIVPIMGVKITDSNLYLQVRFGAWTL